MIRYILILGLLLYTFFTIAQPNPNMSNNKEYFDRLYRHGMDQVNLSPTLPNDFGNTISWNMMQLLNLYEATKDKAYLIQFIHLSTNTIKNRFDVKNNFAATWPPKWTLTGDNNHQESTYFNSLITIPVAKFIYLIRLDNILYGTELPMKSQFQNPKFIYDNLHILIDQYPLIHSISTYGDFADWLGERVEETTKYLDDNYWDSDFGNTRWMGRDTAAELNFQSCIATLYLYMYKINHNFGPSAISHGDLGDKLNLIVSKYNGISYAYCNENNHPNFGPHAGLVFNPTSINGKDLLEWGHYGWEDYNCYNFYKEDIAHGAMDLFFPLADYELGQEFFNDNSFFEKVHNTFTENIWVSPWKFYNNVYGTDTELPQGDIANHKLNYFYHEVLDWMPLSQFDSNDEIYNSLMTHSYNIKNNLFTTTSCNNCNDMDAIYFIDNHYQGLLGLSEVVKAQWKKECVNLTLYNRDLVYDQDFNIKNRLSIKPEANDDVHYPSWASFADPIIHTPTFTIEEGVTVNMVAGESIDFYPGTSVVAGGNLSAKIQSSDCTDGRSMSQTTANANQNLAHDGVNKLSKTASQKEQLGATTSTNKSNEIEAKASINDTIEMQLVPNPAHNEISILNGETGTLVTLYDVSGHLVLQHQLAANNVIDISNLNKGLYLVQLQGKHTSKMQRFIKQ